MKIKISSQSDDIKNGFFEYTDPTVRGPSFTNTLNLHIE